MKMSLGRMTWPTCQYLHSRPPPKSTTDGVEIIQKRWGAFLRVELVRLHQIVVLCRKWPLCLDQLQREETKEHAALSRCWEQHFPFNGRYKLAHRPKYPSFIGTDRKSSFHKVMSRFKADFDSPFAQPKVRVNARKVQPQYPATNPVLRRLHEPVGV
ncbi:unnamed protein product [Ectocarpus sp. 12 AP-2014]